jgi:hypothetical protein
MAVLLGAIRSTERFKTIDGKVLEINRKNLTKNVNDSIKFWNAMKSKKGFKREADNNLKFWRFLKNQL